MSQKNKGLRLGSWSEAMHPRGAGGKFGASSTIRGMIKKAKGEEKKFGSEITKNLEAVHSKLQAGKISPELALLQAKAHASGAWDIPKSVPKAPHQGRPVWSAEQAKAAPKKSPHEKTLELKQKLSDMQAKRVKDEATLAATLNRNEEMKKQLKSFGGRPIWTPEQVANAPKMNPKVKNADKHYTKKLKVSKYFKGFKASMQSQPLYLSAATDHGTVTLPPTEGRPTKIQVKVGEELKDWPITYLEKDVIEEGDYVHPITKQKFRATTQRLDHWAKTVNDMLASGLEIPTPCDHVETQLARAKNNDPYVSAHDNLGFVVGARRVGNRLRLTQQVIGEDALVKAMRNRASIYVLPEHIDEKGRKWTDCIVHSAYTPMPVVTGMGEFLPIAASGQKDKKAPVFMLARETKNPTGDSTMQLDEKQKEQIRSKLVADGKASVADAAAMGDDELVAALFDIAFGAEEAKDPEGHVAQAASDLGVAPVGLSLQALAKAFVEKKDELVLSLQGDNGTVLDDELAADRLADAEEKIDGLVLAKKIKPTQATVAKALLKVGTVPNKLMLARTNGGPTPASALIKLLGENDETGPVAGGKTGDQTKIGVKLSREDADSKNKKIRDEAEAYAKKQNRRK